MAEDSDQRTEAPSHKKLSEARQQGQIALSREVNTWFVLATATAVVTLVAPSIMTRIAVVLRSFIEMPDQMPTDRGGLGHIFSHACTTVGVIVALPLGMLTLAAIAGRLLQAGLVIGGVMALAVLPMMPGVDHFVGMEPMALLSELKGLLLRMIGGALGVVTVIAAGDYFFNRFEFMRKMRMTKQEVKEEHKQSDGDPVIRGRLRQLRMERARRRMMQAVPKADVVVTNPTHYAVAMKYDPAEMAAPIVVAKGADLVALAIRKLAQENDVAIVESPPLARALYAAVEVDQEIPPEHYRAVAEIISYVFRLKGRVIQN